MRRFKQGDIVRYDDDYFLVLSNNWVNKNSRKSILIPAYYITSPPTERRRTHMVVTSKKRARYLLHCEDITNAEDYEDFYKYSGSVPESEMDRVRKRMKWMFGGQNNAKSR